MKRAREKSGTCDGTGTQANKDGDGNQYGADETDNDGKNGVRDQSCQAE